MHPGLALRIYFMSHHETSEEQKFLVGVRREKEAFERLINERGVRNSAFSSPKKHTATISTDNAHCDRCPPIDLRRRSGPVGGGYQFSKRWRPKVACHTASHSLSTERFR